jgi:hypothetical protein
MAPTGPQVDDGESNGMNWNSSSGARYHFMPSAGQISGTGNAQDLSDRGWVTTALAFVEGTGADFLSAADKGVPGHYVLGAALDLLQCPAIFGGWTHAEEASSHIGTQPTCMTFEFHGSFADASSAEPGSGFGLVVNGGSILTAADAIAMIVSDGTNFVCQSAADSDVGALVDNAWHEWKIVISQGTTDAVEWFIDRVSQGTFDLRTDAFPAAWGTAVEAAGTNFLKIGPCEIEYC